MQYSVLSSMVSTPVEVFVLLYMVVLNFESGLKSLSISIQIKKATARAVLFDILQIETWFSLFIVDTGVACKMWLQACFDLLTVVQQNNHGWMTSDTVFLTH